jgi:iron(III) transport system substrate-binding protein
MRQPMPRLTLVALLSLALAVACGAPAAGTSTGGTGSTTSGASQASSAGGPSGADLALYDGPDRQQRLEDGARKEGKLTWYTSSIRETIGQPMMNAFSKKYPFVQVEYYRANGNELRQRLREEAHAGRGIADVYETTTATMQLTQQDGLFVPYRSPSAREYPADTVEPGNHWVVTRELYPGIGYNTNLIRPEEAPRTIEDLLDPRWKGRMGLPTGDVPTQFIGLLVETRGEPFVEHFGQQDVRTREVSQAALANLVASGEIALTPAMTSKDARALQAKGAPIGWGPTKPINPQRASIALVKNAPHPHAALLFLDFILSRAPGEGQEVFEQQTYGSPGRGEGATYELVDLMVRPDIAERYEYWTGLLNKHVVRAGQ